MEILLCRHGETNINVLGKFHLPGDGVGLNAVGKSQASSLAALAAKRDVRAIFASPEKRAIETAQTVGRALGIEPVVINDLRERNWDDWNGESWSEVELKLKSKSLNQRYTFVPPNGESWKQMEQRLKSAVDKIALSGQGNIMIVTHGGALRALVPVLKREERARSLGLQF